MDFVQSISIAGCRALVALIVLAASGAAPAQNESPGAAAAPEAPETVEPESKGMTGARLAELLRIIDPEAEIGANSVQYVIGERQHILVFDEAADRMRLMSPVVPVDVLSEELMYRMLQANYDSALDARYATAQDVVWSVFIHPLSSLDEGFLASAIKQVHTAAETFGTTFSSGALVYGGGDSQEQLDELEEALKRLLNPTT